MLAALNDALLRQERGAGVHSGPRPHPARRGRPRPRRDLPGRAPPPAWRCDATAIRCRSDGSGTVPARLPSPTLHETTTTLEPGDALLLYTDGVVEGRRGGDFFGEERLSALLRTLRDRDAPAIAGEIAAAAVDHQGGTPADDIAVVVVRRSGFR